MYLVTVCDLHVGSYVVAIAFRIKNAPLSVSASSLVASISCQQPRKRVSLQTEAVGSSQDLSRVGARGESIED